MSCELRSRCSHADRADRGVTRGVRGVLQLAPRHDTVLQRPQRQDRPLLVLRQVPRGRTGRTASAGGPSPRRPTGTAPPRSRRSSPGSRGRSSRRGARARRARCAARASATAGRRPCAGDARRARVGVLRDAVGDRGLPHAQDVAVAEAVAARDALAVHERAVAREAVVGRRSTRPRGARARRAAGSPRCPTPARRRCRGCGPRSPGRARRRARPAAGHRRRRGRPGTGRRCAPPRCAHAAPRGSPRAAPVVSRCLPPRRRRVVADRDVKPPWGADPAHPGVGRCDPGGAVPARRPLRPCLT